MDDTQNELFECNLNAHFLESRCSSFSIKREAVIALRCLHVLFARWNSQMLLLLLWSLWVVFNTSSNVPIDQTNQGTFYCYYLKVSHFFIIIIPSKEFFLYLLFCCSSFGSPVETEAGFGAVVVWRGWSTGLWYLHPVQGPVAELRS